MQINLVELSLSASNENLSDTSLVQIAHKKFQQDCWKVLAFVNQYINFNNVDVLQLAGNNLGPYTALMARQYPMLNIEFENTTQCRNSSRILWINNEGCLNDIADALVYSDAIVVSHRPDTAISMIEFFGGFARVGAIRDIGNGDAVSIFGRGLMRDIFKPKVRG